MIYLFFTFVMGLIVGSFLNVLILRLPKEESVGGRSHCNHCKHELGPLELVPLFSYIFLLGKCRHCKRSFSPRYFTIELVTGLLFTLAFAYFNPVDLVSWLAFTRAVVITSALIVFFVIDLEHFLILDKVILFSSLILLPLNMLHDHYAGTSYTLSGIVAALLLALFFGLFYFFSKGTWIGMGDIKFSVFLGLATPGVLLAVNIFLASALGSILGIFLLVRGSSIKTKLPFGTFLSLSCIITLYVGERILNWYLALLGIGN
jgi:leader peptidase (prepilin peptidase) / N-methyltransferase